MCVCYHLIVNSNFNTLEVPVSNPSEGWFFLVVCLFVFVFLLIFFFVNGQFW